MKRFVVILFGIFLSAISYADTCTQSQIDLGNGNCIESKFEITTVDMPANTIFKFKMSAAGVFYVDWGDGNVQTITRNDVNEALYYHEYSTSGEKIIRFAGRATGYSQDVSPEDTAVSTIRFGYAEDTQYDSTPDLIAAISGSLGAIFPTLGQQNGLQPRFVSSFSKCSALKTIPEELFSSVFGATDYMFARTFGACTGLTSIPENLFSGVSGSAPWMFYATFTGCTGLTSIPENLFSGVSDSASRLFSYVFYNCYNLRGYIPPSTFSGLIKNDHPVTNTMWSYAFYGTNLKTTCPSGTTQYITGYEGAANNVAWFNKVSCVDESFVCDVGTYFPAHGYQCEICPAGSACSGGTYNYSETTTQGIVACASGTFSPTGSAVCYPHVLHVGNDVVYLKSTKQTTPSLNLRIGGDVFYANMITERTRMSKDSSHYLHVKTADNVHYYVCDDTTCPQ